MVIKTKYHPIVEDLVKIIETNKWKGRFEKAIKSASSKNVPLLHNVTTLDQYLDWVHAFLYWVPKENSAGSNVNDHLCAFYFIADQEPILSLQNNVIPYDTAIPLTPFSKWLVDYAN